MEKWLIKNLDIGYCTGKVFSFPNANGKDKVYPKTVKEPENAKHYTSYAMALRGMKALEGKCDVRCLEVVRMSEYEGVKNES